MRASSTGVSLHCEGSIGGRVGTVLVSSFYLHHMSLTHSLFHAFGLHFVCLCRHGTRNLCFRLRIAMAVELEHPQKTVACDYSRRSSRISAIRVKPAISLSMMPCVLQPRSICFRLSSFSLLIICILCMLEASSLGNPARLKAECTITFRLLEACFSLSFRVMACPPHGCQSGTK